MSKQKIIVFATSFSDELFTMPDRTGEAARRLEEAAERSGYSVEYRCDRDPSQPLEPEELEETAAVIADLERYDRELLAAVGAGGDGKKTGGPVSGGSSARASLRLISRYGTGCNAVDIEAAREFGVMVTNTPGVNSLPMAEWALASLVDVASRRINHHERAAAGKRKEGPSRIDLAEKTVGIVGTGASARHLVSLLQGFHTKIIASAPRPDHAWAEHTGVAYVKLDELCRRSDFISLHASAAEQIIGEREISLMRPTTVLVNCARSMLVDNRTVWRAVRDGRLWGYGIDEVWEHPDLSLEGLNIIASPHVASDTDAGKLGMQLGSVDAVVDFIEGRVPKHRVTE